MYSVSNSHGAGGQKVGFGITFGLRFGGFGPPLWLILDILEAKSRKMGDPKSDPKNGTKKGHAEDLGVSVFGVARPL